MAVAPSKQPLRWRDLERQFRVESVSSPMLEAAVELLDAAIISCPPYCRRRTRPVPMAAKADERAFVFDNRMAGYGAEPTPERPTDDACERRFVADSANSTKEL